MRSEVEGGEEGGGGGGGAHALSQKLTITALIWIRSGAMRNFCTEPLCLSSFGVCLSVCHMHSIYAAISISTESAGMKRTFARKWGTVYVSAAHKRIRSHFDSRCFNSR